jgi:hypothetical protein
VLTSDQFKSQLKMPRLMSFVDREEKEERPEPQGPKRARKNSFSLCHEDQDSCQKYDQLRKMAKTELREEGEGGPTQ